MGRIITIISGGFAVSSFVYIFSTSYIAVGISFALAILIIIAGFIIEDKLKESGVPLNKIMYHLSKNDKEYNCESVKITYYVLDNDKFECKKDYEIKSKKQDLRCINDHFMWSLSSDSCEIVPNDKNHKIQNVYKEEGWTHYSTEFDICSKNKKMRTGSTIKNLHVENRRPESFLSQGIPRKTKLLIMEVEFPENFKPEGDATFKIKVGQKVIGKPESIKFDKSTNRFTKTIRYPRKGWKYLIFWNEKKDAQ